MIEEEFREDNTNIFRVHGDWVGIDADHPRTIYDGRCVPIININKLELLK